MGSWGVGGFFVLFGWLGFLEERRMTIQKFKEITASQKLDQWGKKSARGTLYPLTVLLKFSSHITCLNEDPGSLLRSQLQLFSIETG